MHIIKRLFDGEKTKTLTKSDDFDARDHVSMALQISGLGPNTGTLYGTIFEPNRGWLPIKLAGSTIINKDGIYIVPPYFRFYRLVLNRTTQAEVYAYFYALKEGSFYQEFEADITTVGEMDEIRSGDQATLKVDQALTDDFTVMSNASVTIPGGLDIYLSHSLFSIEGSAGASVHIIKQYGPYEEPILKYTLNGNKPTTPDPVYFLHKVDRPPTTPCTIFVRARKLIYNYNSTLFGRVTILTRG